MDEEPQTALEAAGLSLAPDDVAFFEALRARVVAANERMNLTRLTGERDFWLKHVLDSALPFLVVPRLRGLPRKLLAADVGSGAGFPGLVLARLHPGWNVALLERTRKKALFLEETVTALEIDNAYVVPFDAAEAPRRAPVLRRRCALVTARAVGRLAPVTQAAAGLLAPGGLLVHYKGGAVAPDEIADGDAAAAARKLSQEPPAAYSLPPAARRSVVVTVNPPRGRRRSGGRRGKRASRGSRGGRGR